MHHVLPTSTSSGPNAGSDTAWAEAYSVLAVAGKTGFALPTILIEMDDKHKVPMRVDSGSCVSILPQSRVPPGYQLQPPPFHLQPLGIGKVKPVGAFQASLRWGSRQCDETMFVIADDEMTVPAPIGERASLQLGLLSAPGRSRPTSRGDSSFAGHERGGHHWLSGGGATNSAERSPTSPRATSLT